MYQNMTHTLHIAPIYVSMRSTKFFCQFIYCFTNNFNVLHQTKVCYRVGCGFFKRMFVFICYQDVYSFEHVPQSFHVSNFFSHISGICLCWQTP